MAAFFAARLLARVARLPGWYTLVPNTLPVRVSILIEVMVRLSLSAMATR